MEVVSSSHSCLAFHQTPSSAWRFRGIGLGPGHTKSTRPRKSAVLCVGTGRASNPGGSGKVHASHGFYASDVDAALQGIPKKAGEIERVMIPGLPEGLDCSQISTGFWEWKPKLTVYYETSGTENSKAPAVLFLPGFGVGTFHFEKQLRDLGRDYKVWTMDFLGQGMSLPCEDPAPKNVVGEQDEEAYWGFGQDLQPWAQELVYSVDLWRNQVQHFIEEVICEPVYIVGNSLGGFVALYFAASNPHLVKGVTLLNATPFWGFLPNRARSPRLSKMFPWAGTFPLPSFVRKLTETVWQKISDPKSIQDILKQVYADHSTNVDKVFARIIETTQHPAAAASFASIMFAPMGQISFQEALSRCQRQGIPISLMYGREDPWVRPVWGIKVKQQVPEAPYYEISPAGHCPHDEVPEVINYLLRGWLKNVESEGSIDIPFLEDPSNDEQGVSRELEFVREGSRKSVRVRLFGSKVSLWGQLSSFLNLMSPTHGAKADGQVSGVVPHLVDGGLSILQYADDTILFMEHDLVKATNMKLLLCAFEQISGLKINFHKSEIFCFGEAKECEHQYKDLFGCNPGTFPMRYLGIPIHYRKLTKDDWRKVEERFEKRLSSWKGKHLSTGGRLTLINSVLSSLPMYMISFFQIPKSVLKKLDYYRSRFFWQCDEHKRKYRLAKWDILCQPKEQGGLGIHNLETKNTALLSKWLYRLLKTDGTWQQILRKKYLDTTPLVQVQWKCGDSHFWGSLMKIKRDFLRFGSFIIKDGSQVRFWEDKWLGNKTLRDRYPQLYSIARKKQDTVAEVLSSYPPTISWRRDLIGHKLESWNNLLSRLTNIVLSQDEDEFRWNLNRSGEFSVKSHYLALIHQDVPNSNERLWKLKVPLKIKIFLWYLRRGVILTKDNLVKRNWQGSKQCCFCHKDETIQHLFFECRLVRMVWAVVHASCGLSQPRSVSNMFGTWLRGFRQDLKSLVLLGAAATCWAMWLCRNTMVFENKQLSFLQVIFSLSHWLRSWAILQKIASQDMVVAASRSLEKVAKECFARTHGWRSSLRIDCH